MTPQQIQWGMLNGIDVAGDNGGGVAKPYSSWSDQDLPYAQYFGLVTPGSESIQQPSVSPITQAASAPSTPVKPVANEELYGGLWDPNSPFGSSAQYYDPEYRAAMIDYYDQLGVTGNDVYGIDPTLRPDMANVTYDQLVANSKDPWTFTVLPAVAAAIATGGMASGLTGAMGLSGTLGNIASGALRGVLSSTITGSDPLQSALTGGMTGGLTSYLPTTDSSLLNSIIKGATGGLVGGGVNNITGGDVNILDSILGGALSGGVGGAISDFLPDSQMPTPDQMAELQFTNPDAYDWYMFNDPMGNLDQTDYSWMTDPNVKTSPYVNLADSITSAQLPDTFNPNPISVGNGEQTGYTGTEQGDTNVNDFEWNQLADIFDMTNGGDPYSSSYDFGLGDGVGIGDLDWQQALDIFDLTGGDDPYNPDGFNFGDIITEGDSRGTGGNDLQSQQDADIFDLTEGGDPYNNGGFGSGSESSTSDSLTSSGVLKMIKDEVNKLMGGGAAGASNSALLYTLLQALMKSKQVGAGNQLSQDAVNMVVNSGEKGTPNRLNTNFGLPKTSVGVLPQMAAPTTNGIFDLGLTRK